MQIRLNAKTDVENKGKYNMAVVHYDQDGQSKEKKLMSFTFPEVYKTLVNANVGDAYDIKAEKDGKFWNWVQASLVGGAGTNASADGAAKTTFTGTTRGGWETPEERAIKQVYIIRQSCLSTAATCLAGKGKATDVVEMAKHFEAYVHGVQEVDEPDVYEEGEVS